MIFLLFILLGVNKKDRGQLSALVNVLYEIYYVQLSIKNDSFNNGS